MAFKLKRRESVNEAVSRLAQSRVKKALADNTDEMEAIHTARKQIKKIRAVLRLVRKDVGGKACQRRIDRLREAAHLLAPPRDAFIRFQTFEDLFRRASRVERTRMTRLRSEVRSHCNLAVASFSNKHRWDCVRKILEGEARCFSKIFLKHGGWSAIEPGLKKSFRAAQKARETVIAQPTPINLHRWRKRVKDLLYNVSLLEPISPEQMRAFKQEIGALAELLGEHHDLHVLRQTTVKKPVNVEFESDVQMLLPLIEARQKELSTLALTLGQRLLREKPSAFSDHLHQYWKTWKRKKQSADKVRSRLDCSKA